MKYKSKHNWFSRTILILCIVALLIRQSKSYYPLWCAPSGTGLNLRTSLCSFSFWFIFCMAGGGCGAITKTKGAEAPRQIRRRQMLWYTLALV